MRKLVIVFLLFLVLWISGSSVWYVCRIRGDCKNSPPADEETTAGKEAVPEIETLSAEAAALEATVAEAGNFLRTSGIQRAYFDFSSANAGMDIFPSGYLDKLKLYLENKTEAKVNITGHTDSSGTEAFNNQLGSLRAEFVKAFLVNSGIKPEQIMTASKGFSEPAAPNESRDGRAKNRRAEIIILM